MSFFPENLKLMSSVGADERDAPAISVRNAAAAVALYAIASRDRCRLTGEWMRCGSNEFEQKSLDLRAIERLAAYLADDVALLELFVRHV
jgi:hypothetical protein